MKEIQLTQGKVTLVDDEKYEYLNQWKWCALKRKKIYYAVRHTSRKNGKSKVLAMHRVIINAKQNELTDHIDGDGLNNVIKNLRIATQSQNQMNRGRQINNTSGYMGVVWRKDKKKWYSKIILNKKQIYGGCYLSPIEAAKSYDSLARQYHRDFAKTNF